MMRFMSIMIVGLVLPLIGCESMNKVETTVSSGDVVQLPRDPYTYQPVITNVRTGIFGKEMTRIDGFATGMHGDPYHVGGSTVASPGVGSQLMQFGTTLGASALHGVSFPENNGVTATATGGNPSAASTATSN